MNNNYFNSYLKKDCNGCGICSFVCPKNAIKMIKDKEGFEYPIVDESKCIKCGLCQRRCPNITPIMNDYCKSYIAYTNNKDILKDSSSGGMFYSIAKAIINSGGVVFGVAFDDDLKANHECVTDIEGLKKMQGSKYVRSDLNNCYENVVDYLKENKLVLFTGTPCQCAAVRSLVNDKNDNLFTCEIICHANPSPLVFELYKQNLEIKYKKKVINIEFRSKKNGWKNQTPIIMFDDNTFIEDNSYFYAFVRELINRPSCYDCRFSSSNRLSDFTIGDIWGLAKINKDIIDDDSGLSLICINSKKAEELFNSIISEYTVYNVDKEVAFLYNHNSNLNFHKKRRKFFNLLENGKIDEKNIIYYLEKYSKLSLFYRIKRKLMSFFDL